MEAERDSLQEEIEGYSEKVSSILVKTLLPHYFVNEKLAESDISMVSNLQRFFFLSQQFEKFQENHEYKMKQAELQVLETRNQKENAELSLKNEIQSWQKKLYEEEEARQKVCFIALQLFTNLM